MGNPTNITLFGLGPRVGSQPTIVGLALARLNASARAAVLVLGDEGKKIQRLTAEFIRAARTNNAAKALVAREKLARLLAGLSKQDIQAIHDRARGRRTAPTIDRFAPFNPGGLKEILAGRGEKELEPSEDRQIAERNDHQKARQALGRISTAAVFDDATSFNELKAIATGSSYMASAARVIVERWEEWHLLAAIDDRLTLARAIS